MIWKNEPNITALNDSFTNTLSETLGMQFTEVGADYLKATMPVNQHTVQPFRILHGGASMALAETLGSVASLLCLPDPITKTAVGLEINANHLTSAKEGDLITGKVYPAKIGKSIHVWRIDLFRQDGKQICASRFTVAIIDRR